MKLYYHPASTTSRPIMLFAAERARHRLPKSIARALLTKISRVT